MTRSPSDPTGFTLIELLAATTIFAIIMVLLLSVLNAFEATGDIKVTKNRMAKIATKAGEYYLSRENLPLPWNPATNSYFTTALVGDVPVATLHLKSKYRLDSWGNPFRYFTVRNDGANGRPGQILIDPLAAGAPAGAPTAMVDIPQANLGATPPTGKTLITGIQLNNRPVAGVVISSGPNGVFEYTQTAGTAGPPATLEIFTLNAGSDDLILAIDLTTQATQIVETELKKLGEKVRAFDDRYIGKDNDNDNTYDENGCNAEGYPGGALTLYRNGNATNACTQYPISFNSNYFPIPVDILGTTNDLSCGFPTLDDMKANYWNNNPLYGYYYPQITGWGRTVTANPTPPPANLYGAYVVCQATPADYYRVPMNLGAPVATDCHWGLVGDPTYVFTTGQTNSELTNDQARAALFCAYGLAPADIVDPWLNGYVWGCGTGSGQGGNPCANEYADTDPRFHKFFSAGPDQTVNTADDIATPL